MPGTSGTLVSNANILSTSLRGATCIGTNYKLLLQDYAYDFDLTVSEGDVIKMSVTATSTTAGTAVLENQTTGKSVSKTFSGNVEGALCQTNAEWIVEDVSIPFYNPNYMPNMVGGVLTRK